jgi:WD40 repeat protein
LDSDQPVHLYDAYIRDHVRASYRPYNSLDEMEAPNVVTFSNDGQKIICGGFRTDRTLHIFDTSIPGRDSTIMRLGKTRRSSDGQKGLISSISFGVSPSLIAVGTYAPGSIYLYDLRSSQQPSGTILNGHCIVGHGKGHARKKRRFLNISKPSTTSGNKCEIGAEEGDLDELNDSNWLAAAKGKWYQSKTQGGVTQLQFAPNDDYILYSASRRSNSIIAWDIRMLSGQLEYQTNPIQGISSYETINNTNQRLEFDLDVEGKTIYIGGQDNCLRIYDIKSGKCKNMICNLDDSVNGVSHTIFNGRSFLAIATGSRRFASLDDFDDDDNCTLKNRIDPPGYLRLYDCTNSI